jgi:hypothetical protein
MWCEAQQVLDRALRHTGNNQARNMCTGIRVCLRGFALSSFRWRDFSRVKEAIELVEKVDEGFSNLW